MSRFIDGEQIAFTSAFSLVEVTLALGIAAFCLIAVFGLIPVGVQTNRNATSQTAATNIMAAVIADLRATPKCTTPSAAISHRIRQPVTSLVARSRLCHSNLTFPGNGQFSTLLGATVPLSIERNMEVTGSTAGLLYADLKVTWPARCHGGKCEWIDRNVCRVRQELAPCDRRAHKCNETRLQVCRYAVQP